MVRRIMARVARFVLDVARTFTQAMAEGVIPHQERPTSVAENIDWGSRWLTSTFVALLSGQAVQIDRQDLVMLALFLASIIVVPRVGRPVIIYAASPA